MWLSMAAAALWVVVGALDAASGVGAAKSTRGGGTGTPAWAPASFDCGVRRAAWEYGRATLPQRGSFRTLFDAMQLGTLCGDTPPAEFDKWSPPTFPTPDEAVLYCDASATPGSGDGSLARPFASVAHAVSAATGMPGATIALRGGVYYEHMMRLGPEHSGITIQNYRGEHAVVSGAVPLARAGQSHQPQWTRVNGASPPATAATVVAATHVGANWTLWPEVNNVFARAPNPNGDDPATGVKYLGTFSTIEGCASAAASNRSVQSFTWFHPRYPQPPYASHCYGTTTSYWETKHLQPWVMSGRHGGPPAPPLPPWPPAPSPSPPPGPPTPPAPSPAQVWALDLSGSSDAHELGEFLGLRLNGLRQIRAKYPNGDPEISGAEGWITSLTEWLKPADKFADGTDKWAAAVDIVTNASQWPGMFSQNYGSMFMLMFATNRTPYYYWTYRCALADGRRPRRLPRAGRGRCSGVRQFPHREWRILQRPRSTGGVLVLSSPPAWPSVQSHHARHLRRQVQFVWWHADAYEPRGHKLQRW